MMHPVATTTRVIIASALALTLFSGVATTGVWSGLAPDSTWEVPVALAVSSSEPTLLRQAITAEEGFLNPESGVIQQGTCCRAYAGTTDLLNPETGVIQQGPCCRAQAEASPFDELPNPETGVIVQGPGRPR